jgi:hypothetical protein
MYDCNGSGGYAMNKRTAILFLVFGYVLYMGYVSLQTIEMIDTIKVKTKTINNKQ